MAPAWEADGQSLEKETRKRWGGEWAGPAGDRQASGRGLGDTSGCGWAHRRGWVHSRGRPWLGAGRSRSRATPAESRGWARRDAGLWSSARGSPGFPRSRRQPWPGPPGVGLSGPRSSRIQPTAASAFCSASRPLPSLASPRLPLQALHVTLGRPQHLSALPPRNPPRVAAARPDSVQPRAEAAHHQGAPAVHIGSAAGRRDPDRTRGSSEGAGEGWRAPEEGPGSPAGIWILGGVRRGHHGPCVSPCGGSVGVLQEWIRVGGLSVGSRSSLQGLAPGLFWKWEDLGGVSADRAWVLRWCFLHVLSSACQVQPVSSCDLCA